MADRDDLGTFLMGFIIGGLTGAVVSLILAPQSGEETRTQIRDKAIELRDKASETAEDAYARAETAAAEARARADEWAAIAKARAEELQRQGQVVLEQQKGRLGSVISSVKKGEMPVTGEVKIDSVPGEGEE